MVLIATMFVTDLVHNIALDGSTSSASSEFRTQQIKLQGENGRLGVVDVTGSSSVLVSFSAHQLDEQSFKLC